MPKIQVNKLVVAPQTPQKYKNINKKRYKQGNARTKQGQHKLGLLGFPARLVELSSYVVYCVCEAVSQSGVSQSARGSVKAAALPEPRGNARTRPPSQDAGRHR